MPLAMEVDQNLESLGALLGHTKHDHVAFIFVNLQNTSASFKPDYLKQDIFASKVHWCWSFLNELVSSQIVCKLVLKQDNSPSFSVAVKVFGRSVKSLVSAEPQLI